MVVVFVKNLSVLKQEMSGGLACVYVWCSVDATMHQLLEMILSVVFHWVNAEYKQTQPLMMIKYCKRQWTEHKTNSACVCVCVIVCRILHFIIRICGNTVVSMLSSLRSLMLFFLMRVSVQCMVENKRPLRCMFLSSFIWNTLSTF